MTLLIDVLIGGYLKRSTDGKALYRIAAGPLGTIYFTCLVTGLSLGFSLLVLALVGVLILLAVLVGTLAAAEFERWMAINMLGQDIPPLMAGGLLCPWRGGGIWACGAS